MAVLDWLQRLLEPGAQPQGDLARIVDRAYSSDQPYQQPEQLLPKQDQPHTWDEAIGAWYGLTGIPDIQKGWQTYQEGGGVLPAVGQGGAGLGQLATLLFPAAKAFPAFARTVGPLLGDEIGAIGDLRSLRRGIGDNGGPPLNAPKFPQYAEEYPPVGPPTMKVGERGNIYPEKTLTPEAIAFAKERNRVMKDMAENGYTPYFNPADRSYVDPSNYPPANIDTAAVRPQKAQTIADYAAGIDAPETMAALRHAYARGVDLGDSDHWYAMAQLERKYIDELGVQPGRAAFLDEFAAPMAATTSGNNPTANFLMAHYLEYMRKQGQAAPVANQLPYPIGGRRGQVNLDDYARMREGGGYPGIKTPKMQDFSRSFLGDLSNPTIDEQMAGGMFAHMPPKFANNARTTAYGMAQQPVRDLAAELGIPPGNVQDVAWAGFKNEAGGPMISQINDAIERTHRLTGMPHEEIVRRGIIRKEIPIYGLGALGIAGGLGGLGGVDGQY